MIDQSFPQKQQTFVPPTPVPGVIFRLARNQDLQQLRDNCYPETDWRPFLDHYTYLLKWQENGRCAILVAETVSQTASLTPDLENRPVEIPTIVGSGQLIWRPNKAEIAELAILPVYRNRGIGTAIIQILTQIAREKNTKVLEIGAAVENQSALRLYRRLGFGNERIFRLPDAQKAIFLSVQLDAG